MASNKTKVTIGPTQPIEGPNPPNPAETLRTGALGTRSFPEMTMRRPFSIPTKSTLHRSSGLSNDEFNQPGHEEEVGEDMNQYSHNSNTAVTEQGQPIRGT